MNHRLRSPKPEIFALQNHDLGLPGTELRSGTGQDALHS